ncbi:MAG: hypothetical protein KC486_05185 [Myxococcales bacterium]|nr:hypothetical protein [Myxococcales bacterium]
MPSKRSQLPLAALLLGLVPLACGGAVADAPPPAPPEAEASAAIDANDRGAADDEDAVVEGWDESDNTPAPTVAQANAAETNAEAITFDGEDADPELATQIRSAPERPPIPAFRLFGTRAGDGPG